MSEENTTNEEQSAQAPELVNPHSLGKQVTGLVVAAVVAIALLSIGGVVVAFMGAFTFLDAWNSGIYKQSGTKALSNMSPMGWGIGMMAVFIVVYPLYLVKRNKLKTKDGPVVYWVLLNILGVLLLLVLALQIWAAMYVTTA